MDNYIIDRIEGKIAICEQENRETIEIPLMELYDGAKEGDCFALNDGIFKYDGTMTKDRRKRNIELQNNLFEE